MRRLLVLGLVAMLSAGAAWAGAELGSPPPQEPAGGPLKLDPGYRRLSALGFREVQADLLWLQAGIDFGQGVRGKHQADSARLFALIDAATDLDPHYYDAYWCGATLLPPKEAIALLKKGAARFQDDWKLPEMTGFLYYVALDDAASAAKYYELAASKPNHPPYVPSLAGRLYSEVDDLDSAIRVLQNFEGATRDARLKADFRRRIEQLGNIRALTQACQLYRQWQGRAPQTLSDLVAARVLPELPRDPYGGRYYLNERGRVACSTDRNHLKG